jgi:hypothetical protein
MSWSSPMLRLWGPRWYLIAFFEPHRQTCLGIMVSLLVVRIARLALSCGTFVRLNL